MRNAEYTVLVIGDQGIIASETFDHWVAGHEAVQIIRELYPEAIAVLDARHYHPLWADRYVSFS